jgi:hypothetical protein
MLPRLVPLLFLAVSPRSPDMASCRLVGTWLLGPRVHEVTHDYWSGERSDDQVKELLDSLHASAWDSQLRTTEVFHADGTWELKAPGNDVEVVTSTWRLLAGNDHAVSVDVAAYVEHQYGSSVRRFEFERPDLALEGLTYWIRAADTK